MALVKCPECGREKVSDSAEACPDCGFNIRKYYEDVNTDVFYMIGIYQNKKFIFLNGFEEGTNGIYTSDVDRNYYVKNGLVYLPGGDAYILTDKFLVQAEKDTIEFEGHIPNGITFDVAIYGNHFTAGKSKWIFSKDGTVTNEDGERGIYRRKGDFLAYKMSNSSSITLRDSVQILFIHEDKLYYSGFVKENCISDVMALKNEIQNEKYPFEIPMPIESNSYSYSSNIPKCPICQSANLKKISGLSKAGSVAMWGIFAAGRTSKTWHCNNCGSEW